MSLFHKHPRALPHRIRGNTLPYILESKFQMSAAKTSGANVAMIVNFERVI